MSPALAGGLLSTVASEKPLGLPALGALFIRPHQELLFPTWPFNLQRQPQTSVGLNVALPAGVTRHVTLP